MKKKVLLSWLLVVLVLLVAGCEESYEGDLPPEPAAPYMDPEAQPGDIAGMAYGYAQGFAPPYDVYENDEAIARLFFLPTPEIDMLSFEEDTFDLPIKVEHTGGLVYNKGYVYTKTGWVLYTFPQATFRSSAWIVNKGEVTLTLDRNDFTDEENWIVSYSCKKHGGQWRCGMQEKDGAGRTWMLESFRLLNLGEPDEPEPLSGVIEVCVDTDGGKVYPLKGTVTGPLSAGAERTSADDVCVDANTLKEWYCTGSNSNLLRESEDVGCPNGCADGACTAAPAATPVLLTVVKTGSGTVTTTSNPTQSDQIDCGIDCTAMYFDQTTVTLTAVPDSGYSVTWSESGCSANTCFITTGAAAKTVTVTFTAAAVTGATGTVVCEVPLFNYGATSPAKTTLTSTVTQGNAPQKCADYQIFGTAAKDAFTIDGTKLTGVVFQKPNPLNSAEQHDWLRCTLTCVPDYEQATTCKDITGQVFVSSLQNLDANNVNSPASKTQLYVLPSSLTGCS